ncbi:MAG: Na/Pi symporter [Cyclobacteriaceae bacterium]|nr:Na/Pi symporter [Cyclobacteriaceae bacterium]
METTQPISPGPTPPRNRLITALWIVVIFIWFVFALDLMVSSLKALGEPAAEFILQATSNPFTALFIGLLATAMIQSSSTTTSLVVALVVSGSLTLENAVPIIMGANIGTTITSTLVSLGFIRKKKEFRRAVAAGTYHDFFNILTVAVLFPLEYYYNVLSQTARSITTYLLKFLPVSSENISSGSPLSPVTDWLVSVIPGLITPAIIAFVLLFTSILVFRRYISGLLINQSPQRFRRFFFQSSGKAFFWGLVTTAAIRSSTITTSVAVPLVAQKITSLRRAAPFILGANMGTTITAILAALLNFGSSSAISIALTHFLFNCIGIILFYLIPPLREIPFYLANRLGRLTLRYRLVGFVYLLTTFFFLPFSLIYLNQNPSRASEVLIESVDMRSGKTTLKKMVVRQHRSNLSGEWLIYDNQNNFRILPLFRRSNTLLIGDNLWILGPVGTCWTGSDSLGNYNRCVDAVYSQWKVNSNITFDSVYLVRQEQSAGSDSITTRFYVSAMYPLIVQQERFRNNKPEFSERVIRVHDR